MSLSDFLNNRRKRKSGATRGSLTRKEYQKLSKTASGKRSQGGAGARIRKAKKALSEAGAVTEAQAAKKAAKAQRQSDKLSKFQKIAKTGTGRQKHSAKRIVKRLTDSGVKTKKKRNKDRLLAEYKKLQGGMSHTWD